MGSEELDELIAEALASYSGAKPRPGLERRVLNRLPAVRPARRRFLSWAFGAAAVAVSVVSPLITSLKAPVRHPRRELITQSTVAAPVLNPQRQLPVRLIVPPHGRKAFGAPAPLTDQEKALLALVERVPLQARELLSVTEPQPIEPITIQEISISPLELNGQ
jgi:hypothetical protein